MPHWLEALLHSVIAIGPSNTSRICAAVIYSGAARETIAAVRAARGDHHAGALQFLQHFADRRQIEPRPFGEFGRGLVTRGLAGERREHDRCIIRQLTHAQHDRLRLSAANPSRTSLVLFGPSCQYRAAGAAARRAISAILLSLRAQRTDRREAGLKIRRRETPPLIFRQLQGVPGRDSREQNNDAIETIFRHHRNPQCELRGAWPPDFRRSDHGHSARPGDGHHGAERHRQDDAAAPDHRAVWADSRRDPGRGRLDIAALSRAELYALRRRMGMLFQNGALLTDISVFENVAFPLREHTDLPERLIRQLVLTKLQAVGLRGAAELMPGGAVRRHGPAGRAGARHRHGPGDIDLRRAVRRT